MIARAGYPGIAADIDQDLIDSIMPSLEAKARELQPGAEVEGHGRTRHSQPGTQISTQVK